MTSWSLCGWASQPLENFLEFFTFLFLRPLLSLRLFHFPIFRCLLLHCNFSCFLCLSDFVHNPPLYVPFCFPFSPHLGIVFLDLVRWEDVLAVLHFFSNRAFYVEMSVFGLLSPKKPNYREVPRVPIALFFVFSFRRFLPPIECFVLGASFLDGLFVFDLFSPPFGLLILVSACPFLV